MTGVITSLPPLVEQPPGNNSSNPAGLPGVTYVAAIPILPQTWTGLQTFTNGSVQFAGSTSGNTLLNATAIASGTVLLPAITGTDTLLTNNNVAVVTNKSIDGLTNTITNVPTGSLDPDLQALAALTGTGIAVRTAADTWALRNVAGTTGEITATNGDGVAGNPTLSLPNALTFTGKTITGGTYTGVVSINGNIWTAGTGTLTLGAGKTATISNTLTFTGTDASSIAFGTGGTVAYTSNNLSAFAATTSAQLRSVLSDETGTGFAYFQGGDLGTPSAGVLSSATGLPISTGVSGLATGVATFLATPSSANLRAALTDEVGTGAAYFVGGALGTPASGTATNLTGLPLSGLTVQGAYTIAANATGSSAVPTAMDITALTSKPSPVAGDIVLIQDSAASNAFKRTTVGALASAGSVASIGGLTGVVGVGPGIVVSGSNIQTAPSITGYNRLINGQFAINQRVAAGGVTNNAYGADRWRVLTEAASVNLFPNNYNTAGGNVPGIAFQFSGTTDKGGLFQVIEGVNCKDLRGLSVTLSMLLLVSNVRLGNMKIGILEWTGTEDATTATPISSWGADGVTPTLNANWAFKNTPANLSATASSVAYSTTVTLGSTFTNLAVMIWNDDKVYTALDNFSVSNVQIQAGGVALPYDQRLYTQELLLCQRYYAKDATCYIMGYGTAGTLAGLYIPFKVTMRATPTVAVSGGTPSNATALTTSGGGPEGQRFFLTVTAAGTGFWDIFTYTATAEI